MSVENTPFPTACFVVTLVCITLDDDGDDEDANDDKNDDNDDDDDD